jgi:hypothetical protein
MPTLRRAGNARPGRARSRAAGGAAGPGACRAGPRRLMPNVWRRRRRRRDHARRAGGTAGGAQGRTAGAPAGRSRRGRRLGPVRRLLGHRLARARQGTRWRVGCTSRPAPSTNPKAPAPDYWRAGRAMFAAGFRAGDLVHNSFSYHLTPGAWIMESGAHGLGCTVFPGGVGNTEMQLQAMRPTCGPTATAARPASCASCSRRPPRPAWRCRT